MDIAVDLSELEEQSFMLFRQRHAESYMRMVMYQCLINIHKYEGIRLSRLIWELERGYQIPEDDVRAAVGALSSPYMLDAVHVTMYKRDGRSDAYLKGKSNSQELLDYFAQKERSLAKFRPLVLRKV